MANQMFKNVFNVKNVIIRISTVLKEVSNNVV